MTATSALTKDLQKQVLLLEDDLRKRVAADPELEGRWKQEHHQAVQKERTAAAWVTWRDDRVTQAAVAWVLATVFIRFCEDNSLVSPVWICGPKDRRQEALDAQLAYFRSHPNPDETDREWLQTAVDYLAKLPSTAALVDDHSAARWVSPSGDAVTVLLDFWRKRDDDGVLVHDLRDTGLSTRFLGDLYQDLSEHAKSTFALLQTPVFVEEFILDRTLTPALEDRPLEGFKLIDPACGSGHFLLGAFDRLLDRWERQAPGLERQARVQAALDSVNGVDLNPFAVAIARFRLMLAALKASDLVSLEAAPAFRLHLAVGDSLVHGPDPGTLPGLSSRAAFLSYTYATEDGPLLLKLLEEGRYDAVVGNPPYITVDDKALNRLYRSKYPEVCKGGYALTVPFMALFFALAKGGESSGWVGQITSNSFMKREFGSKLIENLLSKRDLQLLADTSGAFIPDHGTPTVIIVGRNRRAVGPTVRAVLGVRGEPGRPEIPAMGVVWRSIVDHIDTPGWDDEWVTVADLSRDPLASHPWSLSGGGAFEVKEQIENSSRQSLSSRASEIGFGAVTREDEAYMLGSNTLVRRGVSAIHRRPLVEGKSIRDWAVDSIDESLWPYSPVSLAAECDEQAARLLWPARLLLASRVAYGSSQMERGLEWYEYSMFFRTKFLGPFTIAIPTVSTHVHAALDRKARVFKDTSVLIKLPEGSSEDDYLEILAGLNSSIACFWLKQVCHDKGIRGEGGGFTPSDWERFYQYNGSNVRDLPLPSTGAAGLTRLGRSLDQLARELAAVSPSQILAEKVPSSGDFRYAREASEGIWARMTAIQEELDWECYRLYGVINEDATYPSDDLPGLALGERVFEISLARSVKSDTEIPLWFARHGSTPISDIPTDWPIGYQRIVQRRLDLISENPGIRLLEKPEYKRRWAREPWEKSQERAVRVWLLDRLEDRWLWFDGQGRPLPRSVAQLADEVARDDDLVSVLGVWEGRPDVPITRSLIRLLADEAVPYLAAYRYKDPGMRKREVWEQTWALQRQEDAGEKVGVITVPPKYTSTDFRKSSYWQARGKLDVPKERFILYPDAGRETDPTPLLGWAGWDHAQQSLALSIVLDEREKDGWDDERLIPLVAGLAEVQPWVEQWHSEVDPAFGVSMAAFCREQLTARAVQIGRTLEELAAWRPSAPTRGRKARSAG